MGLCGWNVYRVDEVEGTEAFCGRAETRRAARRLAAQAERSGRVLPRDLWATADAAGGVDDMVSPDREGEDTDRTVWIGVGGRYAMVPVYDAE